MNNFVLPFFQFKVFIDFFGNQYFMPIPNKLPFKKTVLRQEKKNPVSDHVLNAHNAFRRNFKLCIFFSFLFFFCYILFWIGGGSLDGVCWAWSVDLIWFTLWYQCLLPLNWLILEKPKLLKKLKFYLYVNTPPPPPPPPLACSQLPLQVHVVPSPIKSNNLGNIHSVSMSVNAIKLMILLCLSQC